LQRSFCKFSAGAKVSDQFSECRELVKKRAGGNGRGKASIAFFCLQNMDAVV
jgi:hypothetical protein